MPSHDARLLLVDDDPSAIHVMSRMLAQYPHQRFATSGEEALTLARKATPDLILMDADMPGMTGLDVCEALKADPILARVPVIFATSHHAPQLEVAALESGAVDFVTKPLIAAQVTARVRAWLRASRPVRGSGHDSASAAAPSGHAAVTLPKLLVVDDDVAAIRILHRALATMGQFNFATSGADALQMARRIGPDLILLDNQMQGLDGFAICKTLKAELAFQHVPIVFVTSFSDPRIERRAFDLGAADFIAKPYAPAVVQARVRNLLDLKRRTDAEQRAVNEGWRRIDDASVVGIVSAATDAIISHNAQGNVVLANTAACRMFNTRHEQVIGRPLQALVGEAFSSDKLSPHSVAHHTLPCGEGQTRTLGISVSRVGEGAQLLTTLVLRDAHDRERRERREDKSQARRETEPEHRVKAAMLSYVAHEMGTSLQGTLGHAQLMMGDTSQPLPAAQANRLQHLLASGWQLQTLLRDLLDHTQLLSGRLRVELGPVSVAQSVEDAIAAVSALALEAGVALSCTGVTDPTHLLADAARLRQCLVALLTNAIKYNRPAGWVRVEARSREGRTDIAVRDNGPGLNESQRQHLFEPFNRLDRQRAAASGSGLGLVLTRQLVRAMNGELSVESDPQQGSCFTLMLPSSTPPVPIEPAVLH